jgi:hypothetical protein
MGKYIEQFAKEVQITKKIHEEMFNIFNHMENVHHKNTEISVSNSSQDRNCEKNDKC